MPDFSPDMRIDPLQLDRDWLEQPELLFKYMEHQALCKNKLQEALDSKKTLAAALKNKAAMGGESIIGVKPTGDNVEAWAKKQPEYAAADKLVREAQLELDLADAGVMAMRTRKDALENLTRLVSIQYFAPPRESNDLSGYVAGVRRDRVIGTMHRRLNADPSTEEQQEPVAEEKKPTRRGRRRRSEEPTPANDSGTEEGWAGPDLDLQEKEETKFISQEEMDELRSRGPSLHGKLRLGGGQRGNK